ncbi:hypothetical protein [Mesorhizobium sp. M0586]|uniref:hypothetical protein n=1 Tax=unclassified Mesorhizobium TaxID=325217 RepID=UPI00333536ED
MAIAFADQAAKIDEQIRKLEAEKQKIQAQAHDELKQTAQEAIEKLNGLGYNYRIVENTGRVKLVTPKGKGLGEKGTRTPSSGPCPICQFETTPHHDARKHRSQPEGQKKPFTASELSAMGLTKV